MHGLKNDKCWEYQVNTKFVVDAEAKGSIIGACTKAGYPNKERRFNWKGTDFKVEVTEYT